jgi:hypothetical protein
MPETVEAIGEGIVREWFFDRQVVGYRLTRASQIIIQDWSKLVLETMEAWKKGKPYLALHDISTKGVSVQYATMVNFDLMNIGVTDSGRALVTEFLDRHPDFRARIAIGFNLSISGQVSQVVMDRIKSQHPSVQYRTFFNREKALIWLSESREPPQPD